MPQFISWLKFRTGRLLARAGLHVRALQQFRSVLHADPDNIYCRRWLAATLQHLNRHDEAVAEFNNVIARRQEGGGAWDHDHLAWSLHWLKRYEEAISAYSVAAAHHGAYGSTSLNLGICHEVLGNWQDAAIAYRRAANLLPNDAEAFTRLGDALDHLGHPEDAEPPLRRAMELKPRSLTARVRLAGLLNSLGRHDEAMALLRGHTSEDSTDSWALCEVPVLLKALGRQDDAQQAARLVCQRLSERARKAPNDAALFDSLGFIHGELGEWEEGARWQRRALTLEPTADRAVALGFTLEELRRPHEALEALREGLRLDPSSPDIKYRIGLALVRTGSVDEAIILLQAAVHEHPGSANLHATLAGALLHAGRVADAMRSSEQALALDPQSDMARTTLGTALLNRCEPDKAVGLFERGCRENAGKPGEVDDLVCYGKALIGLERFQEAEVALRRALTLDPGWAEIRMDLARMLGEINRHEEALALVHGLCDEYPTDAEVHTALSEALRIAGRMEDALAAAERALATDRDCVNAQVALGWGHLQSGNPGAALTWFDRASQRLPEFTYITASRGAALSALGRHEEAVAVFDAISAETPGLFKYYADDLREYVERSRQAVASQLPGPIE